MVGGGERDLGWFQEIAQGNDEVSHFRGHEIPWQQGKQTMAKMSPRQAIERDGQRNRKAVIPGVRRPPPVDATDGYISLLTLPKYRTATDCGWAVLEATAAREAKRDAAVRAAEENMATGVLLRGGWRV